MKTEKIASSLIDILPERMAAPSMSMPDKKDEINKCKDYVDSKYGQNYIDQFEITSK